MLQYKLMKDYPTTDFPCFSMKVQKVYLLQQPQILGNPTQCRLRHFQAYKKAQKAEPPECLALRTRGGTCTCRFLYNVMYVKKIRKAWLIW